MNKDSIIITGGSSGIGLSTACLFLKNGFKVVLISNDAAGLEAARRGLIASGHDARAIEIETLDLADTGSIRSRVPLLCAAQKNVAGLVNNAAVEILKNLTEFTEADFETTWRVNMLAPIVMIQACHPFLKKAGGSVVNIGSISDCYYVRRYSMYGPSKAFLNSFSRHAAKELGFDGVRINLVTPGPTDTPLLRSFIENGTFSREVIRETIKKIPWEQRFATPAEIAETIFFAVTGPGYLHGADIRVDGSSV